jgi:hypothetical protein
MLQQVARSHLILWTAWLLAFSDCREAECVDGHVLLLQSKLEVVTVARNNASNLSSAAIDARPVALAQRHDVRANSSTNAADQDQKAPRAPVPMPAQVSFRDADGRTRTAMNQIALLLRVGDGDGHLSDIQTDFLVEHGLPVVVGSILLGVFILVLFYWRSHYVLGKAIELGIESMDKRLLGVDVDIGSLAFSPLHGVVEIHDFRMHNVEGFSAPYIAKVKHMKVDIDMWRYTFTCGKYITIQEIDVQDAHIIFEKSMTSSNLDYIMDHLQDDLLQEAHKPTDNFVDASQPQGCASRMLQCAGNAKAAAQKKMRVIQLMHRQYQGIQGKLKVHLLKITGASVTLEARGFPSHGASIPIADMFFPDLSEKAGSSIPMMIATVVKQVMTNAALAAKANLLSRPPSSLQSTAKSLPSSSQSLR